MKNFLQSNEHQKENFNNNRDNNVIHSFVVSTHEILNYM